MIDSYYQHIIYVLGLQTYAYDILSLGYYLIIFFLHFSASYINNLNEEWIGSKTNLNKLNYGRVEDMCLKIAEVDT